MSKFSNFCKILIFLAIFGAFLVPKALFALRLEERNYLASIKATRANVRSGPGINYPVKFTYNTRNIPVKVISKYDNWNEIEDFEGEKGWISQSLLSRKRTVIVKTPKSSVNLYSAATQKSRILLKLENKVIAKLMGCKDSWCKVELKGKKGWLEQKNIWPRKI